MPTNKKSVRDLLAESEQAARARMEQGQPLRLSPEAKVNKEKDEATVYLYDAIGGWWGIRPADFVPAFDALTAQTIHLRVNSPGGVVTDAEAIQSAVQRKVQAGVKVLAHIDGLAASAATYIAIAASEVEMSDGGFFMIHNAWGVGIGGAQDMRALAELLDKMNANIRADYVAKTGKDEAQVQTWMDAETLFNAAEALENGFVDRIFQKKDADDDKAQASAQTKVQTNAQASAVDVTDAVDTSQDASARERRARALTLIEVGA